MANYQRNGEVIAMFQPGKETNIPTSSGAPMGIKPPDFMGKQVFSVDGVTITIGLIILVIAGIWLWTLMSSGRKR